MNLQLTLRHSSILASQGLSDPTDIAEAEAAKKAKSFIMQKILNFLILFYLKFQGSKLAERLKLIITGALN